jgi:phosphoribosylformimino-5-aminoimidazole carboxamide ribotide isomerase
MKSAMDNSGFLVIPAIDLKDGRCVRLRQGRADDAKVYSDDPVEMARRWADEGAQYLHVVDLDGAFQGQPAHTQTIARIAAAIPIPLEVGGGLRTNADIRQILEQGAARAIIGTRALADAAVLRELVTEFGSRLAVGIDARDRLVQVKGWVETTGIRAAELAKKADAAGVATLICTDTATDGMLHGTNAPAMLEICRQVRCNVIASGGVCSANDIAVLTALRQRNLAGAIVGKALYEGTVRLRDLIGAASESIRNSGKQERIPDS